MNDLQVKDIAAFVRRPYVLISIVVGIGLLLNGYIVNRFIIPEIQEQATLQGQIEGLKQQQSLLSARPVPVKVSVQELNSMVSQVPVRDELSRFLIELKETEKVSGAVVDAVKEGKGGQGAAQQQQGNSSAPKTGTGTADDGTPSGGTTGSAPGTSAIQTIPLTVQVHGGYQQVISFMNRLHQLERLVAIQSWSLSSDQGENTLPNLKASEALINPPSEAPKTDEVGEAPVQNTRETMNLTLSLAIYSAKAYVGKFPELPPIPVKQVDKRLDPTWKEESFRALLQTQAP